MGFCGFGFGMRSGSGWGRWGVGVPGSCQPPVSILFVRKLVCPAAQGPLGACASISAAGCCEQTGRARSLTGTCGRSPALTFRPWESCRHPGVCFFFENGIRICCSDSHISDPMVWDIMRKKFRNKTRCCKYRSCQTTTTGFAPPSPNEKSMSDGKFTLWNYRHKCGSGCSLVLGDIDPQHKKSCSRGDRHR